MGKKSVIISAILVFFFSQIVLSQVPTAPTNLHIKYIFTSALNMEWDDKSTNELGFYIERSQDGVNFTRINNVGAGTTSYADIGLTTFSKYYYRIQAFNISGSSGYSNVITCVPTMIYDCAAGTDTLSASYPFYTTYTDSRTLMLYLKSEMFGPCSVGSIWNMAFYIKSLTAPTSTVVTVKMKNTTDTVVNRFIDTGFTTVYNNLNMYFNYNGWVYFNFYSPFIRDLNKNLLIEVCFHHTSPLSSNIVLRASNASNKVWHSHKNTGNGCSLDSGSVQPLRPNIQMTTVIDGVRKITSNTPADYYIDQNYPNPFNGETKFKFKVKDYSPVTLSMYDILGRQEVVIFSEPLEPGEYEKTFSLSAHPLPSGIYYYCFVANGFVSVKKMVLLK